ncbi:hypothetical protein PFICI_15270 [Pestalotiopsis fici W106-1]|uniref:Large ribosomal subunit protein mL50 n=1 Tax=Pestalotiopsis fici (strain W106-1 / CGMCC3.15140) TaxID=1229662 RepID=W3WGP3_PESFW|nr:uncharacterized protein PFICI_15270 [Pestalotiopsis fici W106-1]ETS73095.1 hypothetical protein PFICI_15270 [Pestalotiopsis fici W106-1]
MRRIARLGQPSAWQCSASRQLIAPLSTQCAAAGAAPLSTAQVATRTTSACSMRLYSQKTSLPQSLSDEPTPSSTKNLGRDELSQSELESLAETAAEEYRTLEGTFRPPPARRTAVSADQVKDPSYNPAVSAAGLSTVGGLENWWDRRENWDKSGDFAGFKAKKKIQDPRVLETAVRRAVVETIVLKRAGREGEMTAIWPIGAAEELARALALDVQCNSSGEATLVGDHGAVAEDLSWEVQETRDSERPASSGIPMCSVEEATAYLKSWDPTWTHFPLADPNVKFAITKRIFQLTGQLIPDHKLAAISNVSSLLATFRKPPKPKTLTEDIQKHGQQLVRLSNVAFSPKQVTRGDKAKAIGQYKLIEEEFRKRDLHHGHLSVPATREKYWFKGEA